ncbi:putative protease Do-like 14 isoform X1 [Zingiber officinale]|uniref:putative protease Do-like 14 isoform X1 n=1 Tax=Zingiber officinale TaxID=94328 RepID=UPI001C4B3DFA|nr:putative protease Do-like 14 isoform X1 [Zingiber officinale]XP_042431149.1 putative protease Do-like 14 isoform X1 [Zingiber officinale]
MFRALLSRNPRRGVATGLLALTAFCAGGATLGSSSDRPSHRTTDVAISISVPLRQLLSSTPSIFSQVFALSFSVPSPESSPRHYSTANPLPPPDPSKDVPCCAGCLGRNTIAKAAAAAGPAVVNICVTEGLYGPMRAKSIGSGTIIDPDGTILTCAHCIADIANMKRVSKGKVGVTLQDGREFEGTVINADFPSDIAVVKIHSKTPLPSVKFGSSSKLLPGDWVIALGCPLTLQNTITSGIVSCVDRKSSDLGLGGIRREYLQTDCAINEGNSGGPLVNLDGEVVGVNIMKVAAADGLSFAVPIDSVIKIIEQFRKNGRVVRPWLGLKMLDLNEMKIAQFKERDDSFPDVIKGVLVPVVTPGSPGDRAGFRPGDVVIEFDGRPVGGIKEIIGIMEDKVGVPLKVLVKRSNNKSITLTVVPEEAVD